MPSLRVMLREKRRWGRQLPSYYTDRLLSILADRCFKVFSDDRLRQIIIEVGRINDDTRALIMTWWNTGTWFLETTKVLGKFKCVSFNLLSVVKDTVQACSSIVPHFYYWFTWHILGAVNRVCWIPSDEPRFLVVFGSSGWWAHNILYLKGKMGRSASETCRHDRWNVESRDHEMQSFSLSCS